ncbi:procathepsin L-like isoform X2 [Acipenser ruthenus]|uniref:procathepsin L-like isoform X2 n=1 Tax=Acipenser ruthenus TaxID=7906 RepID=UPI00274234F4|nr:procathepsin L-like isoform X2 [Acipenser ruthenus]
MQVFVVFLVAVVTAVAAASLFSKDPALEDPWQEWKGLHGKQYSEETESYRRMVWEDNWRFIEQHNQEHAAGKHSYKLGMNHFGDLTNQEFNKMNGFRPDPALRKLPVFNSTGSPVPPKSIDWRVKGYVTRVKNQGACASCWAFSATGALEGQHFKKTRQLVSLSEQNLVDCTNNEEYGNSGCNNGFMNTSFEYVKKNGIASEESYPYRAKDGPCTTNARKVANCSGYTAVKKSERALQDAVASIGPVSVAIDASHCSFQFYKSGIYYETKRIWNANHAVLVVGYGDSAGKKFWILKNSYGECWGEGGYLRLAKDEQNQCGIADHGVYPVV